MSSFGIFWFTCGVYECKTWSVLDLRFYDAPRLKQISIDMDNAFYTFSDLPERQGKHYRDDRNLVQGSNGTDGSHYHINLAWNGNVAPKLKKTQIFWNGRYL